MTQVKSLKYQVQEQEAGYVHRTHRTDRKFKKKSFDNALDRKLRRERVAKFERRSFQQLKRRLMS